MRTLIIAVAAFLALTATASATEPELEARAILPADATWPAPFPGVPNTDPAPAPGSTQPVGGFSALLDAGHGRFWAMPDNGFGNKANSRSFLLRVYKVRPNWETRRGGSGERPDPRPDHAARPRPQGPVPDRQRDDARAPADRRRLRHRVDAHRQGRHAVVRRGVRALHRPRRRHRQGARRAGADAGRDVARQPVPARPHAQPRAARTASRRWRSRRTAARCTRSSRARWPAPTRSTASCSSSTCASGASPAAGGPTG